MATTAQAKRRTAAPAKKAVKEDPIWVWEGINKKGVVIKGEDSAPSETTLRASLRRKGVMVKTARKKPTPLRAQKVTTANISYFARQITTMMKSGVPMLQSLEIISGGEENPAMAKLVRSLKNDIAHGSDFSTALSNHPEHFDDLFVNLVAAGERSGALEDMLLKVADYKEKSENLKKKVKKAMMYPIMIVIAALIVTVILMVFVIPQFEEMFENFGAELPAFTQMVVNLSRNIQAYWYIYLGVIVGSVYFFLHMKKTNKRFAEWLDKKSLTMPIFGNIMNKSAIARYCRTLATMISSGVPLVSSMDAVAGATNNVVYYDAVMQIKEDTSKGVQLHMSMATTQLFPNMVLQMTKIGEESGRLEEMLTKVAESFEQDVDDLVDTLSDQIQPVIMGVLGVLIGGLVIAMYLPIFKLGQAI